MRDLSSHLHFDEVNLFFSLYGLIANFLLMLISLNVVSGSLDGEWMRIISFFPLTFLDFIAAR